MGEHWARLTSLNVDYHLTIQTFCLHGIDCCLKLVRIKVCRWEGNQAGSTVVREVNKDSACGIRCQNSSTSSLCITGHHSHELLGGHVSASVIDSNSFIHVRTIRVVENLAWQGVWNVVSDIIVHKRDDVIWRHPILYQDLVSMSYVSLVTIVPVSVWACYQYSTVVASRSKCGQHWSSKA